MTTITFGGTGAEVRVQIDLSDPRAVVVSAPADVNTPVGDMGERVGIEVVPVFLSGTVGLVVAPMTPSPTSEYTAAYVTPTGRILYVYGPSMWPTVLETTYLGEPMKLRRLDLADLARFNREGHFSDAPAE
jgi:hypothetical protein